MILRRTGQTILMVGGILLSAALYAKDKHPKPEPPQDRIQVIAHIPTTGGSIVHLLTTQRFRRNYLYAEHQSGTTVTVIDITNVTRPTVLARVNYPAGRFNELTAVVGSAALVSTTPGPTAAPLSPATFRILSFADPVHPAVQQEFDNVTAIARDDSRGLIFLANAEGVWILQEQLAMDPRAEKEWEHMMLDAR